MLDRALGPDTPAGPPRPAARSADGLAPVRGYRGAGDRIELRASDEADVAGAVTIVALIRPHASAGERTLVLLRDSEGRASGYRLALGERGRLVLSDGRKSSSSPPGMVSLSRWSLVAVSKAAGAAAPTFHVHAFDDGSWRHVEADALVGDASPIPGGTVVLGGAGDQPSHVGEFAAAALFPVALRVGEVEALTASLPRWLTFRPVGMWILNQDDESDPVLDETGNGADEVGRSGTESIIDGGAPLAGDPDTTIFDGDFATGDTDQWTGEQLEGDTARLAVVDSDRPGPHGQRHYGRFALDDGDLRSEVTRFLRLDEGEDVYVQLFFRLEHGFPAGGVWQLIWQLHHEGDDGSPPVALYVEGDERRLVLANEDAEWWWRGPAAETGRWYRFTVRVCHSRSPTGFVEVWLDGRQRTLTNGGSRLRAATLVDEYNYPKAGYYRDPEIKKPGAVNIAGYRIWRAVPQADCGV